MDLPLNLILSLPLVIAVFFGVWHIGILDNNCEISKKIVKILSILVKY